MPAKRYPGPCEACGREEPTGYYKQYMCNMCYKRKRKAALPKKPKISQKTQFGPCKVCGSETSSNGRFIRGLCSACYRRVILRKSTVIPRMKYEGPCVRCGISDPSLKYVQKMCKKCYKWYRNNFFFDNTRQRAKVPGTPQEITPSVWREILRFYRYTCAYCGTPLGDGITMDHVIPTSKGGEHTPSNVVPACLSCNSKKQNKTDMRPLKRYIP